MSLPRIALLGSCVTRDAWRLPELVPTKPEIFIGRASLASLSLPEGTANPLAVHAGTLPQPATLDARSLRTDLAKSAFREISDARPDVLMLDLVDERFDLLAFGHAVFNESVEWMKTMPGLVQPGSARRIPRLSGEAWAIWRDGLDRLRGAFDSGSLPASRLILHACLWADEIMREGERQALPDMGELAGGRFASRTAHNALLSRMYDAVLARFPEADVIQPPAHLRVADAGHRWGAAPCHFIADYYRALVSATERLGVPIAQRQMADA